MARGKQIVATLDHVIGTETDLTGYIGLPPYIQPHFEAPYSVVINIQTVEDVKSFVDLVGDDYDTLLDEGKRSVKSFWYPALERGARGGGGSYIWVECEEGEE